MDGEMTYQIVPDSIEEKEWLEHLRRDVYQELFDLTFGGWGEERHARSFNQCWDRGSISIIKVDGARVGMIQLIDNVDANEILEFQIETNHQGQGIGTRILKDILHRANKQRKNVMLSVGLKNKRPYRLYQRMGFIEVGKSVSHYYMRYECKASEIIENSNT